MHTYTGCDSVSSFVGKGKLTALKILKSDQAVQKAFADLGKDWKISPELFEKLEEFTCKLVVTLSLTSCLPAKTPCGNMHKGQTIKLDCGDAVSHVTLKLQIQCSMDGELKRRVVRKCFVWTGWMCNQHRTLFWMELLACKCPTTCTMEKCVCLQHGLKCTDMCRVKKLCDNQPCDDDIATEAASIDEDDEDDE
ncbi:hypothetical protein ACOMHN_041289 [Nucella lapillus]